MYHVKSVDKLIGELNKLPGIGEKTAERLSFFILKNSRENVERLADSLREVKEKVRFCSVCGNITEDDPCRICKDETRDRATICVVEHPQDLFLLERVRQYRGLYHVLGGAISPLKGVGPEDVNIGSLLKRVKQGKVTEIILATDPNTEGEATAIYISKLISPHKVKVTRLAYGLPVGGDLEFADEVTLGEALKGRRDISS